MKIKRNSSQFIPGTPLPFTQTIIPTWTKKKKKIPTIPPSLLPIHLDALWLAGQTADKRNNDDNDPDKSREYDDTHTYYSATRSKSNRYRPQIKKNKIKLNETKQKI